VGSGPIGDNSGTPSTSFVDVLLDNSITTFDKASIVDGGMSHMCALEQTGLIRCWGSNSSGQLGDGTQVDRFGAKEILGFNATSVATGTGHSCAISPANEVFCWGTNPTATGVGSTLTPLQVVGVPGAAEVSVGNGFTCMVAGDGKVFCWGEGSNGQLGNGMAMDSASPVQVIFP
jgi:alpha-tubulin suppressor-like RCC1 family protein